MKHTQLSLVGMFAVTLTLGVGVQRASAQSDPVAIVISTGSDGLDVIDVTAGTQWPQFASGTLGSQPRDIVYDARSGRIFVAQRNTIGSFNALLPDGRGQVSIPASGEASSIALDPVGRRLFVSYREAVDGQSDGLVNEISIANPASPTVIQHVVPGVPDLQFVAWDALNQRVYVVEDDGRIARTGNGNWTFARVGGAGVVSPGGILADRAGGVWITGRNPARLVRMLSNDALATYTMNAAFQPRGLSFDPSDPDAIYIAVDDIGRIRKYSIGLNTFTNVMSTGTNSRPQDVVKTSTGWLVTANRLSGKNTPGNITANFPFGLPVNTNRTYSAGIEPAALVSVDTPRIYANPASYGYCYRQTGDSSTKVFTLQNTRADRVRMDLGAVTVGGSNPANYVLSANTCSSARLNWGDSCTFTLRFTASGTSVQPAGPFGRPQLPYWPAQVSVASTDGYASTTIGLSGTLSLTGCLTLGP